MNLAEKIFNERTKLDLSQEQFAEQLGVSRQAVSKWETGQSLPDLDKIVMMSRVFGVTTDYLLSEESSSGEGDKVSQNTNHVAENQYNGEMEHETEGKTDNENTLSENSKPRYISDEEVEEYCTVRKRFGKRIGLGVFLCIAGLAFVQFVQEIFPEIIGYRVSNPDFFENLAAVPFLLLVAIAVPLFIVAGLSMGKYEFMEKANLTFSPGMKKRLQEESEAHYRVFTAKIAVGVSLCIIAASVCVIIEEQTFVNTAQVWISGEMGAFYMLLIIAVAVYLFVTAGIEKSTYDILLHKKEIAQKKEKNKVFDAVSSIYWCIVTAGYLAYSFITFDWGRSWIVWPVAGCLFGAVSAAMHLMSREK